MILLVRLSVNYLYFYSICLVFFPIGEMEDIFIDKHIKK